MRKSRVGAKDLLADIRAGLGTSSLMAKHRLTPQEFHEEVIGLLDQGFNVKLVLRVLLQELEELRSELKSLGNRTETFEGIEVSRVGDDRPELQARLAEAELEPKEEAGAARPDAQTEAMPGVEGPEASPVIQGAVGRFDHPDAVASEIGPFPAAAPSVERTASTGEQGPPTDTAHVLGVGSEAPCLICRPASGSEDIVRYPESQHARNVSDPEPLEQALEAIPSDSAPFTGLRPTREAEILSRSEQSGETLQLRASPPAEKLSSGPPSGKPDSPEATSPLPVKEWDWAEIESKAAVWGTRAGVLIVVLGLGYLLGIGFSRLGVFGKVFLVYAASLGMAAAGMVFERLEKYAAWAKIMIAGGWAALYITTFMIHYLPEARLIQTPSTDMFLLAAIAAGMIVHSFKYKSQSLTILTYFIAFVTIALSIHLADQTFFSLVATAVLAVSMLVMLFTMHWYRLALFCLIACYGTHLLWVTPLISTFRAPMGHGMEFRAGLFMILLYWLTFTVAACLSRPRGKEDEAVSLTLTGLNFVLFVLTFRYHVGTGHPELAWYFTGSLLAAYTILAYLANAWAWPGLFRLLLVIAVICSTATLHLKLRATGWVAMGWLVQAQALYVAGLLRDEIDFRRLGIATFVLAGMWLLGIDYQSTEQLSFAGVGLHKRTLLFVTAALLLYVNSLVRSPMGTRIKERDAYSWLFSYAASALWLLLVVKNWFPKDVLAGSVMTAILGLVLIEIGIRRRNHHFGIQGMFFSFLAAGGALYPLQAETSLYFHHGMLYRILCEAVVIVSAYAGFVRLQKKGLWEDALGDVGKISSIIAAAASAVSSTLLYREFAPVAPVWLSLAWTVLGILLVEVGLAIRNPVFRGLGYSVTALALGWTVYGLLARPDWFHVPQLQALSLSTVVAGFFYEFIRLRGIARVSAAELPWPERYELLPGAGALPSVAFSAAATSILLLLLRQELIPVSPLFVATSWIAASVVLLEIGLAIKNQALRWEAQAVADVAFVYALVNCIEPGHIWWGGLSERLVALVLDIVGMYYVYERFFRIEKTDRISPKESYGAVQLSWAAGILLVVLIQWEVWTSRWPAWVGTVWLFPLITFFVLSRTRRSLNFLAQWQTLAGLIVLWTCLRTIPATGPLEIARLIGPHRIFAVVPIIAILYTIFWVTRKQRGARVDDRRERYEAYGGEALCWAASALLVALITVEVDPISRALTTIIWAVIVIILFEVGRTIESHELKAQACVLAAAMSARAVISYYAAESVPGSLISTALVVVALHYLYFRLRGSQEHTYRSFREEHLAAPMICLAAAVLLPALYHEIRPHAWIPAAWGGLLVFIMALGTFLRDRHLINLALIVALAVMLGIPWFGLSIGMGPISGSFPVFVAIAALFAARGIWEFAFYEAKGRFAKEALGSAYSIPLAWQRHFCSLPAAVLLF
ncbi:MAG: hypothetical protein V1792_24585, partial [Pseudomonadota bacterium]